MENSIEEQLPIDQNHYEDPSAEIIDIMEHHNQSQSDTARSKITLRSKSETKAKKKPKLVVVSDENLSTVRSKTQHKEKDGNNKKKKKSPTGKKKQKNAFTKAMKKMIEMQVMHQLAQQTQQNEKIDIQKLISSNRNNSNPFSLNQTQPKPTIESIQLQLGLGIDKKMQQALEKKVLSEYSNRFRIQNQKLEQQKSQLKQIQEQNPLTNINTMQRLDSIGSQINNQRSGHIPSLNLFKMGTLLNQTSGETYLNSNNQDQSKKFLNLNDVGSKMKLDKFQPSLGFQNVVKNQGSIEAHYEELNDGSDVREGYISGSSQYIDTATVSKTYIQPDALKQMMQQERLPNDLETENFNSKANLKIHTEQGQYKQQDAADLAKKRKKLKSQENTSPFKRKAVGSKSSPYNRSSRNRSKISKEGSRDNDILARSQERDKPMIKIHNVEMDLSPHKEQDIFSHQQHFEDSLQQDKILIEDDAILESSALQTQIHQVQDNVRSAVITPMTEMTREIAESQRIAKHERGSFVAIGETTEGSFEEQKEETENMEQTLDHLLGVVDSSSDSIENKDTNMELVHQDTEEYVQQQMNAIIVNSRLSVHPENKENYDDQLQDQELQNQSFPEESEQLQEPIYQEEQGEANSVEFALIQKSDPINNKKNQVGFVIVKNTQDLDDKQEENPSTGPLKTKNSMRKKKAAKQSHHIKPKSKQRKNCCVKALNIYCSSGKQKGFEQRLHWLAEEMQIDQRKNEKLAMKSSYHWSKLRAHVQQKIFVSKLQNLSKDALRESLRGEGKIEGLLLKNQKNSKTLQGCWVNHSSKFYILWETFYAIFVFIYALMIPYQQACHNIRLIYHQNDSLDLDFYVTAWFFILDMGFNCVVQHKTDQDRYTQTVLKSTIYYLRQKYFVDLISNLLFIFTIVDGKYVNENARKSMIKDLQTGPYYGQKNKELEQDHHNFFEELFEFDKDTIHLQMILWARALFYLKLLSIGRILRIISLYEEMMHEYLVEGKSQSFRDTFNNVYNLIKIMLQVVVVQHLLSCFWIILSESGLNEIKEIYNRTQDIHDYGSSQKQHEDVTYQCFVLYWKQFYFVLTTVTTVGYGDNTPLGNNSYNDLFTMVCLLIFGIFYFSFFSGQIGKYLSETNEVKGSVTDILDEKESMINCYVIKHNKQNGTTKLEQKVVKDFERMLLINFRYNIQLSMDSPFYQELTPHIKNKVLKLVTKKERKFFYCVFNDYSKDYSMPKDMMKHLLSSLSIQEISPGQMITSVGDDVNNLYLIKQGSVQVFDQHYTYQYSLEEGSFFGEVYMMLGLYSNLNYKPACGPYDTESIVFKIHKSVFLNSICTDQTTFEHFFNIALQRHRRNRMLILKQQHRRNNGSDSPNTWARKYQTKVIKLYDVIDLQSRLFSHTNLQIKEFFENMRKQRFKNIARKVRLDIFYQASSKYFTKKGQIKHNREMRSRGLEDYGNLASNKIIQSEQIEQIGFFMNDFMISNATKKSSHDKNFLNQEQIIKEKLILKLQTKKLQKNSQMLVDEHKQQQSRQEQLRSETYYVSSEDLDDDISSYQGSDKACDDERDENYMFDHPLDSDDEIEAKYLKDFGLPKYIGDLEQSKNFVTKRDLIEQILEATQVEIEIFKINIRKELQMQKAFKFINSLNKDMIQRDILNLSKQRDIQMIKKSIKQSYKRIRKISEEEDAKLSLKMKKIIQKSDYKTSKGSTLDGMKNQIEDLQKKYHQVKEEKKGGRVVIQDQDDSIDENKSDKIENPYKSSLKQDKIELLEFTAQKISKAHGQNVGELINISDIESVYESLFNETMNEAEQSKSKSGGNTSWEDVPPGVSPDPIYDYTEDYNQPHHNFISRSQTAQYSGRKTKF